VLAERDERQSQGQYESRDAVRSDRYTLQASRGRGAIRNEIDECLVNDVLEDVPGADAREHLAKSSYDAVRLLPIHRIGSSASIRPRSRHAFKTRTPILVGLYRRR
jgi:hypothetical protein